MAGELTIQATTSEAQSAVSPLYPTELGPVTHRIRLREVVETMPVARMIGVRDIKVKYKQAALGPLWVIIAPLGLLAAVTIAFSGVTNVSTGDVPYVVFALAGLAVWTYVQLTMMVGAQAIISNATLVRRSTCPRLALVTSVLISNIPPFAIMLVVTVAGSAITGHLPLQALLIPAFIAWLVVLAWSVALITASVSVRFRDIVAIIPLLAQAGMFVTPVGYPIDNAPSHIQTILALNPVSGVIETFRWSLLGMRPDMKVIAISAVLTVVLAVGGWVVFGRLETRFADYV
jgi:ABC-type polysaccharide/polyol phosphate export permease